MDSISERIAWCIKDSGLTKTAFAKRINVSQPFVSQMTSGDSVPSDRTIADICREFRISEVWLRTGKGDPEIILDEDKEFSRVCEEINLSDDELIKRIIKAYWFLDEKEKAAIRKLIDGFTQKENPGVTPRGGC